MALMFPRQHFVSLASNPNGGQNREREQRK